MANNIKLLFVTLLVFIFLTGCSAKVTRDEPPPASAELSDLLIKQVDLVMSGKAKRKAKKHRGFNQYTLVDYMQRALKENGLMDEAGTSEMEIIVEDLRVRSDISAVMFGPMAGTDFIRGNILIKDETEKVLDQFGVKVNYAFGGLMAADDIRMDWLYEAFAKKVIETMQGYQSQ